MNNTKTILSKQEEDWILNRKITRATDEKEVLIYPMGSERFLSTQLNSPEEGRYPIIEDIKGKNVLVIPGYGNSAFLFAEARANSVTVYDKDPVTIAWNKAFKKYFHYREISNNKSKLPSIGELQWALTKWYPPLMDLPSSKLISSLLWVFNPKSLRRKLLSYMLYLTQQAIKEYSDDNFELDKPIHFYTGELQDCMKEHINAKFDTVYIPYLLGVSNGVEAASDISSFISKLFEYLPSSRILITPSQKNKEFNFMGSTYFCTTEYDQLIDIPGLESLALFEDSGWFKTQGMLVLGQKTSGLPNN